MTWTWTRAGPREWRVSVDTRPQWQRDAERRYQLGQRNMTDDEMREMEVKWLRSQLHISPVWHEVRDPDPVGDALRSIIGWWPR